MRSAGFLGIGIAALFCVPAVAAFAANAAGHQVAARTTITYSADSGVDPPGRPSAGGSASPESSTGSGRGEGESEGSGGSAGGGGTGGATPGNLTLTIPKVAFGANDGLPATLSPTGSYTAKVLVWVTPGIDGATATAYVGGRACESVAAPGGKVETLTCPVGQGPTSAESEGAGTQVQVVVRAANGAVLRSVTFAHSFTR